MRNSFVAGEIELVNLPMRLVQMRLRGHALCFQLRHLLAHLMLPVRHGLFLRAAPLQIRAQPFGLRLGARDHARKLFVLRLELRAARFALREPRRLFLEVMEGRFRAASRSAALSARHSEPS